MRESGNGEFMSELSTPAQFRLTRGNLQTVLAELEKIAKSDGEEGYSKAEELKGLEVLDQYRQEVPRNPDFKELCINCFYFSHPGLLATIREGLSAVSNGIPFLDAVVEEPYAIIPGLPDKNGVTVSVMAKEEDNIEISITRYVAPLMGRSWIQF